MTLLAIDPGRSYKGTGKARQTIGYSLFWESGIEVERGALSFEELIGRVDTLDGLWFDDEARCLRRIHEVVIEDFVNDPQSARGGQRNGTSECIGAVEALCLITNTPFTRQESALLGPAKLHAGYVDKLKHLPHQDSAYLHGYEYLVRKGVLQPKGLSDTL